MKNNDRGYYEDKHLTLTSVVFEFLLHIIMKRATVHLTLTSVVFE